MDERLTEGYRNRVSHPKLRVLRLDFPQKPGFLAGKVICLRSS